MPQQLELFPEIIQESDDIDVLCALLQSSKIGNFQSVLGICSSLSTNAADGAGDRKRPTKSDVQQEAYSCEVDQHSGGKSISVPA